jgi:hypothetical protein
MGNNFLSKLNYIKLKFLIAVIYELHIFINIIHLMSSFLWWSITFVVVLIVRPLNKTGNLSIILPKIQKIVLYSSTVSIVSGFIFFGIITDFQYNKLFYTWWGNVVLISGISSLFVYFNIVSGGGVRSIFIKLKMPKKFYNQTPIILFSMITISIILMILISKVLLMVDILFKFK